MPHKLLLADDSVTIQRVIELTFADEDVQLTAVGDGRQAIAKIEADPPDIVLADVGMPEKDGYEVAAFIKGNPRYAHIPVLLLTGAFEPVDEIRARDVGCDGVLAKPFEPQMVITRVKELLAEASRPAPALRGTASVVENLPGPTAAPEPVEPWRGAVGDHEPADATADGRVTPDASFAVESPMDAAVRIRRRQTMAVPEFGVPPADLNVALGEPDLSEAVTPLPGAHAALSELLDRFEHPPAAVVHDPEPAELTAPPLAELLDATWVPPSMLPADSVSSRTDTFPEAVETLVPVGLADAASHEPFVPFVPEITVPVAPAFVPVPDVSPAALVAEPFVMPEAPSATPDYTASVDGSMFADTFSALLAAETGTSPLAGVPYFGVPAASAAAAPAVDEAALVERITRQVLEQMSERLVRETVTDIVSRVAERLVRDEIDRIKAAIT